MKNGRQMKYFKSTTLFIIIGAIMVLAGFAIYWYSFEIWMIGTPVMAVGAVLLVIGFAARVSDSAYSDYFNGKIEAQKSGRAQDAEPDYKAAEYSFDGNKFSKLDANQVPRSELFVETDIYFGKKTLTVESFRVNAADDTAAEEKSEFALADVIASVETVDIHCAGSPKKASVMTVSAPDGKSCTFPVRYNDIDVDKLIERINEIKKKL